MKAVFIRHNSRWPRDALQYLWDHHTIAIHFDENKNSTNPDDYDSVGAKKAFKCLNDSCEEGALVYATYNALGKDDFLIGEIKPKTKIIVRSDLGPKNLKTVQLSNPKHFLENNYPLLSTIQPQGTISNWPSAQKILEALFNGNKMPVNLASLHPSQLEILCYEYLRVKGLISLLLLPIGRSLQAIDIYGLDKNGNKVYAQVTYSPAKDKKIKALVKFSGEGLKPILFEPGSKIRLIESIQFISIEKVFEYFWKSDNPLYRKLIGEMLAGEKQ